MIANPRCRDRACNSPRTVMIGPQLYSDGTIWFRWICRTCGATWCSQ